ncbi:2Fe-2S iron-sulfur cluster-binding protein [Pedobacter psychroterrae]|uniref:2Fe-2S iron-sulfur cluster binding domain-containing protein n=1 Tax=Pedobacter psychroterrae TaxID=2530453 RepID=A0A4R0NX03_9SPHI|nr:2Fe-2S iron-sulfur cluster-binding protein [Pedobacter psychroterrae]TCD03594.1 2Fe-2S iron-sulfur cluster binding domain-containing protein [Pedobacter psychroterrae]
MELMKLRVQHLEYSRGETLILTFEVIDGQKPSYLAGQFLTLVFNIQGREIRRSYSLCSAPDADEPLAIAIKRVENGEISRFLHHKTRIGDVLQALPPNGLFVYEPQRELKRTVFLFAAGVGITPVFSIIKTALLAEQHSHIVLIYSSRSVDETLFYNQLNKLQEQHPARFKIIYVSSQTKNLLMARLNVFLIEKIVQEDMKFEVKDAVFYTCGPIDYMVTCRITLLKLGFNISQIKRETFVLPEDEVDEDDMTEKEVKDKNTYEVVLKLKGHEYKLDVPYYKTILHVALENKIDVPYSCRAGICSTCTATCIKGGVHMDYNEVLMDDEIAAGRVLVCTGHPTADGTTIVW